MIHSPTFRISLLISLVFHFCILASHEVRGVMFWNYGRIPKTPQVTRLVFEFEPPPQPEPPNRPKVKQFEDIPVTQKDSAKPKDTDLVGLKDSVGKDNAPKGKKVDGTPNLDGKSSAHGIQDRPLSKEPSGPGKPGGAVSQQRAVAKKPQAEPSVRAAVALVITEHVKESIGKLLAERPSYNKEAQARKSTPHNSIQAKAPAPRPKDIGPDGRLPSPPGEKAAHQKPTEVALFPPSVSSPAAKPEPVPPQRQALNPRLAASMPQSFSPPAMPPEARKHTPHSSAGEQGEEAFNIKQHEYAKYYKHITQRVSATLDVLYGGDISLISPRPAESKVIIDFKILRTGEITNVKLVYDGGDTILSSILLSTIRGTPLDPFPRYIKEKELKIRYTFYFR